MLRCPCVTCSTRIEVIEVIEPRDVSVAHQLFILPSLTHQQRKSHHRPIIAVMKLEIVFTSVMPRQRGDECVLLMTIGQFGPTWAIDPCCHVVTICGSGPILYVIDAAFIGATCDAPRTCGDAGNMRGNLDRRGQLIPAATSLRYADLDLSSM